MIKRYFVPLLFLISLSAQTVSNTTGVPLSKVVETYCSGCHNGRMRSPSNVLLDQFDAARISSEPEVWARAYRQLQAGTMPPVGAPRPDRATYDAALASIEQALDVKTAPAAGNQEIAARLASLLWNSAPDAALVQDVERNRLTDTAVLEGQIHRMLADDRAEAFVSRFFFPWLQMERLSSSNPEKKLFPDYEPSLRDALVKETQLFLLSQVRDDRDPVELWSANYTFLNEQLARHYGVPNVSGPEFRRVSLPGPERAGLLGQGSILMLTSRPGENAYTSPAGRSVWLRRHFLGVPPPNPFPNAQPVKPELPITPQTRLLPADPCVTCHRNFFPLAYALENFDALGRWRTHDQAGPVDASGAFVDGSPTNGAIELRKVLLERSEAFRTTITEKLLVYSSTGSPVPARGFPETTPEMLVRARQILRGAPQPRWSALIAAVVRMKPAAAE